MIFARHETFHPRFGWLKKGYDQIKADPFLFYKQNEAHIELGVGKNMANSIRYWLQAFGIALEEPGRGGMEPTSFGDMLFSVEGWDPFLEDNSSLWLLHYKLATNEELATAWYYIFNEFIYRDFTFEEFETELRQYTKRESLDKFIADSSIDKDINCILRMYVSSHYTDKLIEESIDSPFISLDLIHKYEGAKKYSFHYGEKNNLPSEIITALCLDYVASTERTANTISLSKLAYGKSSPGMVCKMNEREIEEAIEQVTVENSWLDISNQAGIAHLVITGEPRDLYYKILNKYYQKEVVMV